MARVLILLDVIDEEAAIIAEALAPVSPEFKGIGIEEALSSARAMRGADTARGLTVQLRSRASAALGGPDPEVVVAPLKGR